MTEIFGNTSQHGISPWRRRVPDGTSRVEEAAILVVEAIKESLHVVVSKLAVSHIVDMPIISFSKYCYEILVLSTQTPQPSSAMKRE
ncbi:hypothetical protein AVEN_261594-1 [Araneus ventricosus]|uniref:Uncharacterized protein n=1 Tax=Araneus ventricosus TaxID=182803 RepID=A0A4Y2NB88_ARAVE|nr:hypothetical protein AVEN_261594-1 [Araneus ventricosus]